MIPQAEPRAQAAELQAIYATQFDAVWHHLRRMGIAEADRDDLAQEVFLIVHRRLASYDRARPLRAWLIGITARVALHYWRSARRRPSDDTTISDAERQSLSPTGDPDHDSRLMLMAMLATLDPDRRTEFILHELEGFSVPEIAELTETGVNTVYSRLRRTREELAKVAERWPGNAEGVR